MKVIVDTNVPVTANGAAPQASSRCMALCARRLEELCTHQVLVLDDGWHIINEYKRQLRSDGQPGVGDAFLKWVLTNLANPHRCELVPVHVRSAGQGATAFLEFPADPQLAGFDPSDRKFVAVALAHPERPPILNAVDSDWWIHRKALVQHNVQVEFLCPDASFLQGG